MALDNLFSPVKIGELEIKNRILSTGHQTVLVNDGSPNDALIAYHEARARGGAGLIITEIAAVHPTAFFTDNTIAGYSDDCIPGYRKLADAVHKYGTKVFGQLFHPGREVYGTTLDGRKTVAYSASESPAERYLVIPQEMSSALIDEVIQGYASTAGRMKKAGLDGVEIVASHGYLPAQFLSSRVNHRADQYGGSDENRLRFVREVIDAVREEVGHDFVLGMRISGDEISPDGLQPDETLAIIRALEEDGKLSYYNVIAGSSSTTSGSVHIAPPMRIDPAYVAGFSGDVKAMVSRPVFVAGRINQPQIAEQVIVSGKADMCGMTRAMICDPKMPSKALDGRLDDIRACIACNQACIGHMQLHASISCIQHPETGRELEFGTLTKAVSKKVAVVGGGPAGMKAASVAASRGHVVTLFERDSRLGGQVLLAQLLPGRAEFGGLVTNLSREVELAGVDVRLNTEVTAATLNELGPDVVIVATGGLARQDVFEGDDCSHIANAWQVLQRKVNPGSSVVIADSRGDWVGFGLAEQLAASGHSVRYATTCSIPGQTIQLYTRDHWMGKLRELKVSIIPYARLVGADDQTAYFQDTANGSYIEMEDVDTIVTSHGVSSERSLLKELSELGWDIHVIGDCESPRTAEEAVYDGLKVGSTI